MTAQETVECPECDLSVPVGLPRDAEIVAVRTHDEEQPFDPADTPPTERVAALRCDAGHAVEVYFRVSADQTASADISLPDS